MGVSRHSPQLADRLLSTLEVASQKQITDDATRYLQLEVPQALPLSEPSPEAEACSHRRLSVRSSLAEAGGRPRSACTTPTCGGRPQTPVFHRTITTATRAGVLSSPSKAAASPLKVLRSPSLQLALGPQTGAGRSVSPGKVALTPKSPRSPRMPHASPAPATFAGLLALADHPLWSNRVQFFDVTGQLLTSSKDEISGNIDRVAPCYLSRLSDTHYKVVQAALRSLTSLLQLCPTETEPYLERLLVKVFQKQADPKEHIRIQARVVTTHLLQIYFPSMLIPVLLKVLDSNAPKVRLLCAEYLAGIVSQCQEYLLTPHVLKGVLSKFIMLMTAVPRIAPEVEKACIKVLYTVHELDPVLFATQAIQVTPAEQIVTHAKLGPQLSRLLENMKRCKARSARPGNSASSPIQGDEDSDKTPGSKTSSVRSSAAEPQDLPPGATRPPGPPEGEELARNIFLPTPAVPHAENG